MAEISVEPHPLLRVAAFATRFPRPLAEVPSPDGLLHLLADGAAVPVRRDETLRSAVRDMLRQGGYRPTGRGKPASEYLVRAAAAGALNPINLAVDTCNAVSLHSGFPVSVVDLGLATAPFRVATAPAGAAYVFNPSGQEIDLGGLVCLWDSAGACANAVRDAQRTKTHPETVSTLSVIWGAAAHETRLREAERWYRALLEDAGARTFPVS
jgi:DNA/RNA-binding domain of Phe-tRNA-synthetase-like protein